MVSEQTKSPEAEALLTRLSDPATVRQLNTLLDNLDTLTAMLQMTQGFLARSSEVVDNLADSVKDIATSAWHDSSVASAVQSVTAVSAQALPLMRKVAETKALEKIAGSGVLEPEFLDAMSDQALPLLRKLAETKALEKIADSGMLEPGFIDLATQFATAVNSVNIQMATESEGRRITMMRLPLMLRDRDFNRGIDFVLRLVQRLGFAVRPHGLHGIGPGKEKK
jgi:uncharacterized protein YjgD (DUF1641 family)